MKRFLIALALASLACCAFGVEPQTNPNVDRALRTNPAVIPSAVRATWRTILEVVATQTLLDHTGATTNIHGSGADTRFLTASETILDAQIPAGIARYSTFGNAASATIGTADGTVPKFGAVTRIRVTKTADQTLDNGVDTEISWNAETVDTLNEMSGATFTAAVTGYYLVSYCLEFAADADGYRMGKIYINGTEYSSGYFVCGATSTQTSVSRCSLFYIEAGQTLTVHGQHLAGAGLAVKAYSSGLTIIRIL